jgi:aquaporin Z
MDKTPDVGKLVAEFAGTAVLVLVGCGAIAIGGFGPAFPVGILPVALAFGLTVMAMIYAIGPIFGCHIKPVVSTLTALHFPFVNVTGLSVNPARSFGPAVFVGGEALRQLWLFLVAPAIGGALASLGNRATEDRSKVPATAKQGQGRRSRREETP